MKLSASLAQRHADLDALPAGPRLARSISKERRIELAIERHFSLIWRALRRFGVPESGADDAAQQVFVVFSQRVTSVDEASERSFLLGVAVRVAANVRRLRQRSLEVLADDLERSPASTEDPESLLDQKERRRRLDGALAALPIDQRHVFVLYEIEGFSLPEIARTLEVPLGTVTSRLRRARDAFEAWIEIHSEKRGAP